VLSPRAHARVGARYGLEKLISDPKSGLSYQVSFGPPQADVLKSGTDVQERRGLFQCVAHVKHDVQVLSDGGAL
jgi:hypothetical protein